MVPVSTEPPLVPICLAVYLASTDPAKVVTCFCGPSSLTDGEPHIHCPAGPARHVHLLNDPGFAARYEERAHQ